MDVVEVVLLVGVVALILSIAIFAAYTTVRDAKKAGQDWRALLMMWSVVFIILLLIFFTGYDSIKDSI